MSGTGLCGFIAVQLRLPPTTHPSALPSLVLGFQAGNIPTGLKYFHFNREEGLDVHFLNFPSWELL